MSQLHTCIVWAFFLIIISACGGEDDCTADDWAGSYSAEAFCRVSGMVGNVTLDTMVMLPLEEVTIVKIDDQTVIFDDGGTINPEIIIGSCEIRIDTSLSSNGLMGFGAATYMLDGNQIIGTAEVGAEDLFGTTDADLNITCDILLERIE